MKKRPTPDSGEHQIFHKLAESPLFATYRKAFTDCTGMSLELQPADSEPDSQDQPNTCQSAFCQSLNGEDSDRCRLCRELRGGLRDAALERAETVTCFAGLRETYIPVRAANQTVAFLTTGQVFTSKPTNRDFEPIREKLAYNKYTAEEVRELRDLWLKSPIVPLKQYEGTITILAAFALQLSELLNRLLTEESHAEPEVVCRARRYVNANLEKKVCLEEVAHHVGVSTFYFCKVFKQSTGMTLTEFVNRRRVEKAKQKLLNPQARVTEVAFDVGYQSLSQFNRSFLKYVGVSPTRYREAETEDRLSLEQDAA